MSHPCRIAIAVALTALVLPATAPPARADGDPVKGATVFKKCAICHSVDPAGAGPAKPGPNLHDVIGRTTGTLEGFTYSDAMRKLGADGHVWTPEEIARFLENPKAMVPGTKMSFVGLKKPEDRDDVLAYLQSLKAP